MSLYSPDANSGLAARAFRSIEGERILTVLGELEIVNAFRFRVFRKEISDTQAHLSLSDFENDLREGILLLRGLPELVFERARQLSQQTTAKLGTRTADLLHITAALELEVDYMFTFDRQQRKLAQSLHLKLN